MDTQKKYQGPADNSAETTLECKTPPLKEPVIVTDNKAAPAYAHQSMMVNNPTIFLDNLDVHSKSPACLPPSKHKINGICVFFTMVVT